MFSVLFLRGQPKGFPILASSVGCCGARKPLGAAWLWRCAVSSVTLDRQSWAVKEWGCTRAQAQQSLDWTRLFTMWNQQNGTGWGGTPAATGSGFVFGGTVGFRAPAASSSAAGSSRFTSLFGQQAAPGFAFLSSAPAAVQLPSFGSPTQPAFTSGFCRPCPLYLPSNA